MLVSTRHALVVAILGLMAVVNSDNVQFIPNFLTDKEITDLQDFASSAKGSALLARNRNPIMIKDVIACRLKEALGHTCDNNEYDTLDQPFCSSPQQAIIDVTTLSRTTDRHADSYRPVATPRQRYELEDDMMVAFVPLETNSNAFFRHGDEDVPIEKGTMLLFDGTVPHHTVISKHMVKMLGPFAFSKVHGFAFVGDPEEECVPEYCESMQCCNMTECCPPGSTGACCFGDGSCSNFFTEEQCLEESNGCFLGEGTLCPAVPCDEKCAPSEAPSETPSDFPSFSPTDAPRMKKPFKFPSLKPAEKRRKKPVFKKRRKRRRRKNIFH